MIALCTAVPALMAGSMAVASPDALETDLVMKGDSYCTQTAWFAYIACWNEVSDDFFINRGNCINLSDADERAECDSAAKLARMEDAILCSEQFYGRLDVCALVGETRYDPDFSPGNFVDPNEIGFSVLPNPYLPLVPGHRWVYESNIDSETITMTVTDKTKQIEGVTCRVVSDIVTADGAVIEDTDDWYAQDLNGNVWYCGEIARDFETLEADEPAEAELVSIGGSWKAGRDGAKPGILVFAAPQVGATYRQEISLGEAEDVAQVISITGTESVPAASCMNDCLVTRDFTAIEPGAEAKKYYKPGVGPILEVEDGKRVELVEFTTL